MIRSDTGAGPVVLLLHAFPLDGSMWAAVVPLLTPLARVLVVDLPALGRSPVPAGDPSFESFLAAVVADLDTAGVQEAVWVGISTGGYLAAAALGAYPTRVSGVALCSTTTRVIAPDVPADRLEVAEELASSQTLDAVQDAAAEGFGATARAERPDLVAASTAMINGNTPAGVAWVARALASRGDTSAVVAGSVVPMSLVFGTEDVATPPERAHELQALRPDAELHLFPKVGHLTAVESPAAFAAAIGSLIARCSESRPVAR